MKYFSFGFLGIVFFIFSFSSEAWSNLSPNKHQNSSLKTQKKDLIIDLVSPLLHAWKIP